MTARSRDNVSHARWAVEGEGGSARVAAREGPHAAHSTRSKALLTRFRPPRGSRTARGAAVAERLLEGLDQAPVVRGAQAEGGSLATSGAGRAHAQRPRACGQALEG